MPETPAVYLLTGVQAAGKSTVGQALAERFHRSVHVHGDTFRRWIVGDRRDMTPDAGPEAHRQLDLRHRLTAQACDTYWAAGFTVIAQDVLLGEHLRTMALRIAARPLYIVVLDPSVDAVLTREEARPKTAYDRWAVEGLVQVLHEQTPRIGLWLDSSGQTVEQTVHAILEQATQFAGA